MKRILFLLALLVAATASADTVKKIDYNPATKYLDAVTAQNGSLLVPQQQIFTNTPAITANGGGSCTTNTAYTINWTKTGRLLVANGVAGCSAISGTVTSLTVPIPNGWSCANSFGIMTDLWSNGFMCRLYNGTNAFTMVLVGTSLTVVNFPAGSGGCYVHFACQTPN